MNVMDNKTEPEQPNAPSDTAKSDVVPRRNDRQNAEAAFPIVGVGASAGGLEAFTQFLEALPLDTGMGFVLVQHLDPEHESSLKQILSRATSLPATEIEHNQPVKPNNIYIIPPDTTLRIANGRLQLIPRPKTRTPHRPIDTFFESLASDRAERAIGVVLSGTANDGTVGLEAIKAAGGITFAQDASAKYDSMPRSAVAAGCVDLVLSPSGIAEEIAWIAKHPYVAGQPFELSDHTPIETDAEITNPHSDPNTPTDGSQGTLVGKGVAENHNGPDGYRAALSLLHTETGVDFSLYKSSTIQRRIARRLVINRMNTFEEYVSFLRGNPLELEALCNDLLINVTSFFRNSEVFEALQRDVFPKLLQQPGDDSIRVWVPGCSSGQEAYSIAIAFVETSDKARRGRNLQVFATDLNESLLERARIGLYPKSLADEISPERIGKFFTEEQGGYCVSKSLREMVVFAKQNVVADPPFSRLDLISCRNLLIYLGPSLQRKTIPLFHYALKPGGFLLLGASESIGNFRELFEPVDIKCKIYLRNAAATPSFHLPPSRERGKATLNNRRGNPLFVGQPLAPTTDGVNCELSAQREADRITVNQFAPPGVIINADLSVLQFRGPTGLYLEPPVGKASFNLLKMAKEGLMLPLRSAIEESKKETKKTLRENVRFQQNGQTHLVHLAVIPLKNLPETFFLILFLNANDAVQSPMRESQSKSPMTVQEEAGRINELEADLSETREYLLANQEQHEAASDELQAASEEVQSANEELQSINEELETSKEELESANEELTTLNDEMSHRNSELNVLNNDLVNFQNSAKLVVLLLGRDLRIRQFSPQAERQFDLVATDLGRPIGFLRHNLLLAGDAKTPLDLQSLCVEVISSVSERECRVSDKAGCWHSLRVRPYTKLDGGVDGAVLMLLEINDLMRGKQAVAAARDYAEGIVETVRDPLLVLDADLRVERANGSFYREFRVQPTETIGTFIYDLGNHQWNIPRLRELLEEILPLSTSIEAFQVEHDFEHLGRRVMLLNARRILDPLQKTTQILIAIEDITERQVLEQKLHASETLYRRLFETAKDGVLILDVVNGRILEANPYMTELSGYPVVDFIGKELWEIGLFRDQAENESVFQELQAKGFVRYDHLPLKSKRIGAVEVEFVSNVYQWDHRRVAQCNIRDISDRSRLEKQTQTQAAELSDLHRRKDEFLAMLSHELRSPLAPISNAVGLLGLQKGSENLVQQQARSIIERQLQHMQRLVDDLLEVSRITTGRVQLRREKVLVNRIVEGAVETARPVILEKAHQLAVSLPPEPIWLDADVSRMEQVLVNLLTNAAKYTGEGGRIWMTVKQEGEECVMRVRDNGVGIPRDLIPHVFDLFTQSERSLDRSQGGLGIGLALVQRLTNLHGGTVEVYSEVGQGSEFCIRLPMLKHELAVASSTNVAVEQPISRRLRVLVVDDNVDTVLSFSLLLRAIGHDVRTAHDGMMAVQTAIEYKPDVVLLDIGLPILNGYEVAKRIRVESTLKNVVLIALTGYGQEADRQRALQAGFNHHLVKPARLEQLQQILSAVPIQL